MEVREYVQTLELSLDQAIKLAGAQRTIYLNGFGKNTSASDFASKLNDFSGVMGILFAVGSGVVASVGGWATTIIGLVSGLNSTDTLEKYVKDGSFYMTGVIDFLNENKKYDRIRVVVPMIEYNTVNGYVRFIIGEGSTTGVRLVGGNWITHQ